MTNELKKIPYLGAGPGLRKELADQILLHKDEIDVLEITSEHYINTILDENEFLKKFNGVLPLVPHGLNLSIGSVEILDENYLKKIKSLCNFIKAPYYSDHFAITEVNKVNIGHLSPVWFTKEILDIVVDKINRVQDFLGIPLVLENITSFFIIPEADFEESEFISEVTRRTGCGLLLDLANIHINAYNRKVDGHQILKHFPLESVVHIHLAGGLIEARHDWFHDTHSRELNGVNSGIWDLLSWVVKQSHPKTIIIERDQNFKEDFEEMMLNDIRKIKELLPTHASHIQSR